MKRKVYTVLSIIFLVLGGVFFYLYYNDGLYAIDSKYKNEAVRDIVVEETEDPLDRRIDFEKLKAINEDVVGWIYMPDSTIDYPILIGSEDETYLKKDIYKEYNPLGSIFSYSNTKKDLSDGHVMLFGHNMANNQMFGELRKFINSDEFKQEHRKFYIYLENKTLELDIASIFICSEDDIMFQIGRELGTSDYVEFVTSLLGRNKYFDYSLEGSKISITDSQIFSLVTCYGSEGTSERLVVNGGVVREKYYIRSQNRVNLND